MTEDAHPHHVVQKPRKRTQQITVADIAMLVRVPGRPTAIRAYTAEEEAEALQYAAATGGTVVPLPLSPPSGYVVGPSGHLVPEMTPTDTTLPDPAGAPESRLEHSSTP